MPFSLSSRGRIAALLAAAWTLGILVLIAIPPPDVPQSSELPLDKVGHFGAFFLFAWLWMRTGWGSRTWIWVVAGGLTYGIGTEFVQDLLPVDRHPDPLDAAANAGGVLIGTGLQMIWTRIRANRAPERRSPVQEPDSSSRTEPSS